MSNWFAIYTNPRSEVKVAERLKEMGIDIYFPVITELVQWSDRKKKVKRPLFKSYVFVKVHQNQFEDVRRVYGVVNFVYYLGKPAVIRQEDIDRIKIFLSKIDISTVEFEEFEEIIVKSGPLKDQKGIVQTVGKNSLRIILSELKISVIAEIKKSDAQKV